jgi:hypothetical protein
MNWPKKYFPILTLPFWDKIIEILSFSALILLWVMVYNFQHIGAELMPDGYDFFQNPSEYWASKMTYTIPIIATILYVGITFYNSRNNYINFLVQDDEEKKEKLTEINQKLWRWMKFMLILIFVSIEFFSFHSGSGFGTGIPKWYIVVFPLLLFVPVIYFFIEFSQNQLD